MSKSGYTLAEVLITLGIIGVVAAITLPALIKNYQMKVYENAFKKEYSTIQNAVNYITTTEELNECFVAYPTGSSSYQIITTDCSKIREELVNNLQLQKVDNNMYQLYAKLNEVLANGGTTKNAAVTYDYGLQTSSKYMQKDGSFIFISGYTIIFDTNGKKGPNKWGYDIFWMNLTKHDSGKILLTDNLASLKEKGGRYPKEILRGETNSKDNTKW